MHVCNIFGRIQGSHVLIIESCGEKCANLCRVYKLIMISRVPGYGQLEYLEVNYWLISSLFLMKFLGY